MKQYTASTIFWLFNLLLNSKEQLKKMLFVANINLNSLKINIENIWVSLYLSAKFNNFNDDIFSLILMSM